MKVKNMKSRREIYLEILARGLLDIRGAAHVGDAAQCHALADHLHNLPELLINLDKEELHDYYLRITRSACIPLRKPEYSGAYDHLWKELEEATKRERT